MRDRSQPSGERTPAQREADHASLVRLSQTLVPALVAKLNASGLGELEVREGDWRVRLRRPAGAAPPASQRHERQRPGAGHPGVGHAAAPHGGAGHAAEREPSGASREPGSAGPDERSAGREAADAERGIALAPAVGVFRSVRPVGTRVRAGDRIAVVDMLGIPQDVAAPVDGTLVEVFAEEGEAVEYGEEVAAVEADPRPEPAGSGDDAPAGG